MIDAATSSEIEILQLASAAFHLRLVPRLRGEHVGVPRMFLHFSSFLFGAQLGCATSLPVYL